MNKKEKLFYLNMLLLTFALLLANSLETLRFGFLGFPVSLSMFVYPTAFYFANVITKNMDDKRTLIAIVVAFVAQVGGFVLISSLNSEATSAAFMVGSLAAFVLSQLVNLLFYMNLAKPKRGRRVKPLELAFIYIIAILVHNLTLNVIQFGGVLNETAFGSMAMTISVQTLLSMVLVILDKNRKKELR